MEISLRTSEHERALISGDVEVNLQHELHYEDDVDQQVMLPDHGISDVDEVSFTLNT